MRQPRGTAAPSFMDQRGPWFVLRGSIWVFLLAPTIKADPRLLLPDEQRIAIAQTAENTLGGAVGAIADTGQAAAAAPALLFPRQIAPSATGGLILGQPSFDPSTGGFVGYPLPVSSSVEASAAAPPISTQASPQPSVQSSIGQPAPSSSAPPSNIPSPTSGPAAVQTSASPPATPSVGPSSSSQAPIPPTPQSSSAIPPPSSSPSSEVQSFPSTSGSSTSTADGAAESDRRMLFQSQTGSNGTLSGGAIAGIVVGSVIGGLLILGGLVLLLLLWCRKRRSKRTSAPASSTLSEKHSKDFETPPAAGRDSQGFPASPKYGLSQNPVSPRFATISQTPYSPTVKSEVARMMDRQSRYSEFSPVEPYSASSETPMLSQQQQPRSGLSGTTAYSQPPPLAANPRPSRFRATTPSDIPAAVLGAGAASQEKRVGTPVSPITPTFLDVPPPSTFLDSPTNSWPSLGTVSDQQHASMASDRSSGPWMGVSGPMSIDAATAAAAKDLRRPAAHQPAADRSSDIEPPPLPRDSVVPQQETGINEHARKSSDELPLAPPPKSHHRTASSEIDQAVYPPSTAGFNFGLTADNKKASRASTATVIHDPAAAAQPTAKPSQNSLSDLPPPPRSPLRAINTADLPPAAGSRQAQTPSARSGWTTPSGDGAASGYWTPAERTPRVTPHESRENLHSRTHSRSRSRSRTVSRSRAIEHASRPYLPPDFVLAQTSPTFDEPRSPTVPAEQTLSGYPDSDWRYGESTRFADGPSQQLAMPPRSGQHERGGSLATGGDRMMNSRRGDRSTSTRGSSSARSNYSRPRGSESRSRSRSLGRELEMDTGARYDYANVPPGGMI